GGIVVIAGKTITNSGSVTSNGASGTAVVTNGSNATNSTGNGNNGGGGGGGNGGSGGGGSGGSVWFIGNSVTTGTVTVTAGSGGANAASGGSGTNAVGTGSGGGGGGKNGTAGTPSGGTGGATASSAGGNAAAGRSLVTTAHNYGTLYAGTVDTVNADLAEHYNSLDPLNPGDVVMLDPDHPLHVKKTDTAYASTVFGVVSTDPGLVLGKEEQASASAAHSYPIALTGRVPVTIDPSSSLIRIGDYLASGNQPGTAMKANKASHVIGQALENWDPSDGKSSITVFVRTSYIDPGTVVTTDASEDLFTVETASESAQTATDSAQTATASASLSYVIKNSFGTVVDRVLALARLTVANIEAGAVNAKTIATDNLTINGQKITDLIASVVDQRVTEISNNKYQITNIASGSGTLAENLMIRGNATVSGTLTAENLMGKDASFSGTLYANKIANIDDLLAHEGITASSSAYLSKDDLVAQLAPQMQPVISGMLAEMSQWNSASASANLLTAKALIVPDYAVVGQTAITGTTIALTDTSKTLSILPTGGKLDLLAGALLLSPEGGLEVHTTAVFAKSVMVKEDLMANALRSFDGQDLTVTLATPSGSQTTKLAIHNDQNQEVASINASGSAIFRKLIIASDGTLQTASNSASSTSNASTGTANIDAGETSLVIHSSQAGGNSLIYVTPTSSTNNKVLFVSSKQDGQFTVSLDSSIDHTVSFNWWVIN
ncbi:MAG TPA: hypothetical protein VLH19_03765, partial [Patescibacteria group bacterium]|nr:hypothetical protein [Patescibacteria group bacterium]